MNELTKNRQFQLWEYRVSHGSLLIRSPAAPGIETSVDILCFGLEYISAPRHFGDITVSQAGEGEVKQLEKTLNRNLIPSRVWVLEGPNGRFHVVAAGLKIQEHHGDIFESPFR